MNDLISRQAAIDATWFEPYYTDPLNVLTEVRDRLEALPSAQPNLQPTCNQLATDCISRQAAIDDFYHIKCNLQMMDDTHTADKMMHGLHLAENAVKLLPSAQPERKVGKWVPFSPKSQLYSCSLCGQWADRHWNFCPACGAQMEVEE